MEKKNSIQWAWKVRLTSAMERVEQAQKELLNAQKHLAAEYSSFLNVTELTNGVK